MSYDVAVMRIEIARKEKATRLNLSNLQLETVPESLGQLTELEIINLSSNQLTSVPESLGQLTALRRLDLSSNQLPSVPDWFGQLKELRSLNLSSNQLTSVPESLGQLRELQWLKLSSNQLTSVPESLGQLTALEIINLSSNQLTSVPDWFGQLTWLRELSLSSNQLTSVPDWLGQLTWLRELSLSSNQLMSVPDWLGQLRGLWKLDLSSNQLTSVPESLGQLTALQRLDLSSNQLPSVPESLGQLRRLWKFNLSSNQLTSVPDWLGQLTALRRLDLSSNQLTSVPESLGQLTGLQWLELSKNELKNVPEGLGKLVQLEFLNLDHNQLTRIPENFAKLRNLKRFYLHENPGLEIPAEILGPAFHPDALEENSNGQAVLNYCVKIGLGKRPLNEAKIILVGRGGVGKTSLVKRLVEDRFEPDEKRTDGIRITGWKISVWHKKAKVHLNIWDFGGQEIMHATHQFFLTSRSLYLLVLSGREESEEADADYWLRLIESFGDHSPVIVVLNKFSQHKFDLNRRALREKFPFIREFIETDCEDGYGIALLAKLIERETDRLKDVYARFPDEWFELKESLARMTKNYMSLEEYQQACASHGVKEEDDQNQLSGYLHRLGIVLNFQDDARLSDTHVLSPHWVTGGIYAVINSQILKDSKGVLRLDDLATVLPKQDYPKPKHVFLMELMKKFELCFALERNSDAYLIPQCLDAQEPQAAGEYDPETCLNFQYYYPVLPVGLLPRFIVRTHELGDGELRWLTGVILKRDGCRALVKADIQDKKMFIRVSGAENRRRELLAVIRREFDVIHGSISGLKPEEMVPLPKYPQTLIPYKKLLVLEEKGKPSFDEVVGNEVVEVNVKDLLDGVGRPAGDVRRAIVETVIRLNDGQFETLLILLPGEPDLWTAGKSAGKAERGVSLIRIAEGPGGCGLDALAQCLDEVLGTSDWRRGRPGR